MSDSEDEPLAKLKKSPSKKVHNILFVKRKLLLKKIYIPETAWINGEIYISYLYENTVYKFIFALLHLRTIFLYSPRHKVVVFLREIIEDFGIHLVFNSRADIVGKWKGGGNKTGAKICQYTVWSLDLIRIKFLIFL